MYVFIYSFLVGIERVEQKSMLWMHVQMYYGCSLLYYLGNMLSIVHRLRHGSRQTDITHTHTHYILYTQHATHSLTSKHCGWMSVHMFNLLLLTAANSIRGETLYLFRKLKRLTWNREMWNKIRCIMKPHVWFVHAIFTYNYHG